MKIEFVKETRPSGVVYFTKVNDEFISPTCFGDKETAETAYLNVVTNKGVFVPDTEVLKTTEI